MPILKLAIIEFPNPFKKERGKILILSGYYTLLIILKTKSFIIDCK